MEKIYKNILLIAGTGQNVGKTLFASQVIAQHAIHFPVISIKIAPHFHRLNPDAQIIEKGTDYTIIKELNADGNKDSQRFLTAGSKEVYYVQCMDNKLPIVFDKLMKRLPQDSPIICESGGLRQIMKPGIFLIINKTNNNQIKPQAIRDRELADKWIEFDEQRFDFDPKNLKFSKSGWTIQN
ncbi:hypothetical protein [Ancylomarina sp.]|uniref:hypothetical protein n=1 Tax=Ancylomarina sp. TaxID=1970196 RepID=UPI00356AFFFA